MVTQSGADRVHFHTNHCVHPEMRSTCSIPPESSTLARYETLEELLKEDVPASGLEVYRALERVSLPRSADDPHATATCGALVMELRGTRALACVGLPADAEPQRVQV